MCSTPRGGGTGIRCRPVDYSRPGDSDYMRMLRRASQRIEARRKARQENRERADNKATG